MTEEAQYWVRLNLDGTVTVISTGDGITTWTRIFDADDPIAAHWRAILADEESVHHD